MDGGVGVHGDPGQAHAPWLYCTIVLPAQEKKRKPDWMKLKVPGGDKYMEIKSKLRELKLNTVCEEARCAHAESRRREGLGMSKDILFYLSVW